MSVFGLLHRSFVQYTHFHTRLYFTRLHLTTAELLDILSVTLRHRVEVSAGDTLDDAKITGERWNVKR